MGWSLWRTLSVGGVVGLLAAVFVLPDPRTLDLARMTPQQLVELLNDRQTTVRAAAAAQIVERGTAAIGALAQAVLKRSETEIEQPLAVLEELLLSADPRTAEMAESALESLAIVEQRTAAAGAQRVLQSNANLRHARAKAYLLDLGGTIESFEIGAATPESLWETFAAVFGTDSRTGARMRIVSLSADWMGGDDGLKYISRMYPYEALAVHLTDDAPVTAAGLQMLRAMRARLSIRRERESCLGVLVDSRGWGDARPDETRGGAVRVAMVMDHSPAQRGGLQAGDLILSVNGIPTRRYSEMVQAAAAVPPGERVELRVIRQNIEHRIKLQLGSDFRTGICRCLDSEPAT